MTDLGVGDDLSTAQFDQFAHLVPGLKAPQTRVEVEMAVQSHRRLLAQTLGVLVGELAPRFTRSGLVQEAEPRVKVGALVVRTVNRFAQHVTNRV